MRSIAVSVIKVNLAKLENYETSINCCWRTRLKLYLQASIFYSSINYCIDQQASLSGGDPIAGGCNIAAFIVHVAGGRAGRQEETDFLYLSEKISD